MRRDVLRDARLKINRADIHIGELERLISSLPEGYIATIENDPHTGKQFIKHGHPKLDSIGIDIALVAGDAIHNLRTALDYGWVGTLKRLIPDIVDNRSAFPIRQKREDVEAALKGRKIDVSCPTLYKGIVSDIQPYCGGKDYIVSLHDLDISDKHLLLIPLITIAALNGITLKNEETGEIVNGRTWATTRPGPYLVELFEGKWSIADKGKLSFAVTFRNFAGLEGLEILGTLRILSQIVLQTVEFLENL